jgi:hypothetical protein
MNHLINQKYMEKSAFLNLSIPEPVMNAVHFARTNRLTNKLRSMSSANQLGSGWHPFQLPLRMSLPMTMADMNPLARAGLSSGVRSLERQARRNMALSAAAGLGLGGLYGGMMGYYTPQIMGPMIQAKKEEGVIHPSNSSKVI